MRSADRRLASRQTSYDIPMHEKSTTRRRGSPAAWPAHSTRRCGAQRPCWSGELSHERGAEWTGVRRREIDGKRMWEGVFSRREASLAIGGRCSGWWRLDQADLVAPRVPPVVNSRMGKTRRAWFARSPSGRDATTESRHDECREVALRDPQQPIQPAIETRQGLRGMVDHRAGRGARILSPPLAHADAVGVLTPVRLAGRLPARGQNARSQNRGSPASARARRVVARAPMAEERPKLARDDFLARVRSLAGALRGQPDRRRAAAHAYDNTPD